MWAVISFIYLIGVIILLVSMLPAFFQCIGNVCAPWERRAGRERIAAFLWIWLLVAIAFLWPVALVVGFFEWRSMK